MIYDKNTRIYNKRRRRILFIEYFRSMIYETKFKQIKCEIIYNSNYNIQLGQHIQNTLFNLK